MPINEDGGIMRVPCIYKQLVTSTEKLFYFNILDTRL
jgi:hypothetical protein